MGELIYVVTAILVALGFVAVFALFVGAALIGCTIVKEEMRQRRAAKALHERLDRLPRSI